MTGIVRGLEFERNICERAFCEAVFGEIIASLTSCTHWSSRPINHSHPRPLLPEKSRLSNSDLFVIHERSFV